MKAIEEYIKDAEQLLNAKEENLQKEPTFYDNSYTTSAIDNVRRELDGLKRIISINPPDPLLKEQAILSYRQIISEIEERISKLKVIKN